MVSSELKKYIKEETLVNILKDIHMADAILTDVNIKNMFANIDSAIMYKSIFEKY